MNTEQSTLPEVRANTVPPLLLEALSQTRLNYSYPAHVFHVVWTYSDRLVGVFGDGDNGSYEWFVWDGKNVTHSDCGYGSTSVALRDVLNQEEKE
jgi:hypothetical protein